MHQESGNGMEKEFTHFDEHGNAYMVDVAEKDVTQREALASGRILMSDDAYRAVLGKKVKKGDVFTVAQVAGIMGVKNTSALIPMCHTLLLSGVDMAFSLNEADCAVEITATVRCTGQTGVEMEALTAVSVAALTVYDMCKAVQKDMEITDIRLVSKSGGKSGDFHR